MSFIETEHVPIAILATPKTGNLWVKFVMATVFGLENRQFFEEDAIIEYFSNENANRRVVFHGHIPYSKNLYTTLDNNKAKVIALVRNPLDIFLSLRSHIKRLGSGSGELARILSTDPEILRDFAQTYFLGDLAISAMWAQKGAILVKYEDLIMNPLGGFVDLGRKLGVPYEAIGEFAERCTRISDIGKLRANAQPGDEGHFTSAEVDKWKRPENSQVIGILLQSSSIRSALRLWGYDKNLESLKS